MNHLFASDNLVVLRCGVLLLVLGSDSSVLSDAQVSEWISG